MRIIRRFRWIDVVCLICVIVLFATFSQCAHAAAERNLAPNTSFEMEESQRKPVDWRFLGRFGGDVEIGEGFYPQDNVPTNFIAHGGMRCVKILGKGKGGLAAWISSGIRLKSGRTYRLSGWIKSTGIASGDGYYIQVILFDQAGVHVQSAGTASSNAQIKWRRFVSTFTTN